VSAASLVSWLPTMAMILKPITCEASGPAAGVLSLPRFALSFCAAAHSSISASRSIHRAALYILVKESSAFRNAVRFMDVSCIGAKVELGGRERITH